MMQLSSEIGRKRRKLKLGQQALANQAHVSRATLEALENRRAAEIGFSKVVRILAALGLELKIQEAASGRPTLEDLRAEDLRAEDGNDQNLDRRH